MGKILNKAILLLLVAICLTACKKYPEGPLISFRTKVKRIEGIKTITSYKVNGVNNIGTFGSSYNCGLNFTFQGYGSSYTNSFGLFYSPNNSCSDTILADGKWNLFEHKKYIEIVFPEPANIQGSLTDYPFSGEWRIMRLTMDDMWVETTNNGDTHELRFKRNE